MKLRIEKQWRKLTEPKVDSLKRSTKMEKMMQLLKSRVKGRPLGMTLQK